MGRWSLVCLAAAVSFASGSAAFARSTQRAKPDTAVRAFAKAYSALEPELNKTTNAIYVGVDDLGKDHPTAAEIVTVATRFAKQWSIATKPVLALKAPVPVRGTFAAVTRYVPSIEGDLLALAQSGRTDSPSAASLAADRFGGDLRGLAKAARVLKTQLGLGLPSS